MIVVYSSFLGNVFKCCILIYKWKCHSGIFRISQSCQEKAYKYFTKTGGYANKKHNIRRVETYLVIYYFLRRSAMEAEKLFFFKWRNKPFTHEGLALGTEPKTVNYCPVKSILMNIAPLRLRQVQLARCFCARL